MTTEQYTKILQQTVLHNSRQNVAAKAATQQQTESSSRKKYAAADRVTQHHTECHRNRWEQFSGRWKFAANRTLALA